MSFNIGDLVESETAFTGIGKLVSLDESTNVGTVAFFESPVRNACRPVEVNLNKLTPAKIFDEASVYLEDNETGVWRRARYGSRHPGGKHLVLFKRDESAVVDIGDINYPNLGDKVRPEPLEFLEARCTDTPFFSDRRVPFVRSYIEQRAACRSVSSILSSSVEIEPHQVAVVRRVLQDEIQKYLLADEVGLGKTIEACLILREHVLQDEETAHVLIAVPEALIEQWRLELINRFYLGDLLGENELSDQRIYICSHDKLARALQFGQPTMIVIDEAHQICPWAWSDEQAARDDFNFISKATANSRTCLLLSGTPLVGNEENFLALLNLLSPDTYQLSDDGKTRFFRRLEERERLGGMYQAFVEENDNDTLSDIADDLKTHFPTDNELLALIDRAKPLIDWQAPEDGKERSTAIRGLRSYIGENYRLHQRMLRNRRTDPAISQLFPGLAGATKLTWTVDEQSLSVDQVLDAFRDEHIQAESQSIAITSNNFIEWIHAYMTSPMLVSQRAKSALTEQGNELANWEREYLEQLIECAEQEQFEKDQELRKFVSEYLDRHEKAKVIMFCDDQAVSDHVYQLLSELFPQIVERHTPDCDLQFVDDQDIRVLVCDRRGEDGLNLHGGEKYLIHYGLPPSFAQIEQRNGRVNRYSAAIFARPIASAIFVPNRPGYFSCWADQLTDIVNVFDRSVASLQYVLQERIDQAWQRVIENGVASLELLSDELAGPDGLLEREARRVEAQEELNSMNEEVEKALSFAEGLETADEVAEYQAQKMSAWIQQGLHFRQIAGDVPGSFRFSYVSDGARGRRTLVDVISFLDKCITGIDKDESSWDAPVTALMSPDRQLVSHGRQIYPMRYGQPFIDTIFDLSRGDTRGICSARLRAIHGIGAREPKAYFNFAWMLSGCEPNTDPRLQRISDQNFVPQFVSHWIDDGGTVLSDDFLEAVLEAPYSKKPHRLGKEISYQDQNIHHDYWGQLEEYYPANDWMQLVRHVGRISLRTVHQMGDSNETQDANVPFSQLESVSLVILFGS